MAGVKFQVDIENSSGTKLGSGPVASVRRWRYTSRMDRAGDIAFDFAANDPQASIVANRNIARAKALINGAWVEVGAGVIDSVDTSPDAQGRVSLSASGMDLIRELSYRTVGELEIGSGSGATHSAALTAIGALAPAGWTFTPAGTPDNDYIYARYGGESVLGALVYLAERTQTHFYRGTNRTLTFTSSFTDSGVRAIQAYGDLEPEQCAIVSLRRTVDTHDLLTRITPYGSGQGAARLTLAATSRAAPSGYTLSAANNYIEHDAAVASYGQVDFPEIEFKEITPISNTDADMQAAANMLFDAALEELTRRATLASQETYSLTIAGCSQLLRPMQTIRVVYRDVNQNIDIDANLYILEATWEIDESGIGTTALVVSTDDRWPVSDEGAAAERAVEGRVFQAHPQLNANSYVTSYSKNVDENEIAEFRFRFGDEVVNLQQVLFEFQILPFESTVSAVGGVTSGSGDIPTTVPSIDTSGAPSNDTSGAAAGNTGAASGSTGTPSSDTSGAPSVNTSSTPSTNTSSSPSTNTSGTPSSDTSGAAIGNTAAASGNTGAAAGNTGAATGNTGAATGNTAAASGSTGTPSTNTSGQPSNNESTGPSTNTSDGPSVADTGGSGSQVTEAPTGGDIVSAGRHQHNITFGAEASVGSMLAVYYDSSEADPRDRLKVISGGSVTSAVELNGNHEHDMNDHTHGLASHTHSMQNHTHGMGYHTHTLNNHTHDLGSHTHTLNNHTHGLGSHTHGLGSHTHDLGSHTHSLNSHTHGLGAHTHTLGNHTHDLALHTHDLGSHTHTLNNHTHSLSSHTHSLNSHTHSLNAHTHTLGNHTHNLSESLTAVYGIFRESALNTYALTDLDYQVNGGGWLNCEDDAVSAGDGWYQIDITSLVQNATTFRPTAANNLLEIRSLTASKTANIDAQLSVRNTIQAISYI